MMKLDNIIYPTLAQHIIKTDVRRLIWLEKIIGHPVYLKIEAHQKTGSFKYRGAMNSLLFTHHEDTVAVGSAGNHGLAIAEASKQLGRKSNVFVPISASSVKKDRIIQTGSGLVEVGGSVEDASIEAINQSHAKGWCYISPYNNKYVIGGQSTVWSEFLQQIPSLKVLVAPIGGGGLISGAILVRDKIDQDIEIYGCEPETYASMFESLSKGEIKEVLRRPTYADGLATNIEDSSMTFDIAKIGLKEIVLLNEEEIATSVQLMLKKESLLLEGAGALSVLACIKLAEEGKITGPVGLVASGGNISFSAISRILGHPIQNQRNIKLLERFGQVVADTPIPTLLCSQVSCDTTTQHTFREDLENFTRSSQTDIEAVSTKIANYIDFTNKERLQLPPDWEKHLMSYVIATQKILTNTKQQLVSPKPLPLESIELQIRATIQSLAMLRNLSNWRSPAYAQSKTPHFFNLDSQESGDVNYERYGHEEAKRIERQTLENFQIDQQKFWCLVTASGMAAYSVIESFLLRDILSSGDNIVASPGIYFEIEEQISDLPAYHYSKLKSFDPDAIYQKIKELNAKVVLLDPLTNTTDQRMIDIEALLLIYKENSEEHPFIVVDCTMLPAMANTYFSASDTPEKLIYFESASKYLQFGQDSTMAGIIIADKAHESRFRRIRRNTGTILNEVGSYSFPKYSQEMLDQRIYRMEENAKNISYALIKIELVTSFIRVIHPSMRRHQDYDVYKKIARSGGCVTFQLLKGSDHKERLEVFIDQLLFVAKSINIPLVKGVSFGFSVPRVSAASAMAENEPPFLRLSIGDLDFSYYKDLTYVFETACKNLQTLEASF